MSLLSLELVGKQLQLLKEMVPDITHVAVLSNPTVPSNALLLKEAEVAARSMNVQLRVLQAPSPESFESAFFAMTKDRVDGLIVLGGAMFFAERARIAELALQSRLPSMYSVKPFAEAGGLMTYGTSNRDSFRRAATFVDKIIKGAKPGDLPIEQATKFELTINFKTAKKLGLAIPQSLLQRADEVIQ